MCLWVRISSQHADHGFLFTCPKEVSEMNTPLCVNSHFVEICSNDWQSLIYQLSTFFFLFMFSKVILSFTKVCYNKKYKNLYILRTRITILSMNVLSNNSLIFMQSLSTLDAWVGSDILVTLFILTQPSWRKRLVSGWNEDLSPVPLEPSAYTEGRGNTEIAQSPKRNIFKLNLYKTCLVCFRQSPIMQFSHDYCS